jgi:hypothetical protein
MIQINTFNRVASIREIPGCGCDINPDHHIGDYVVSSDGRLRRRCKEWIEAIGKESPELRAAWEFYLARK